VGFEVLVRPGDSVAAGEPLGRVHAKDEDGLRLGIDVLRGAVRIGDGADAVPARPLVSHRLGSDRS
jgi:thymidine phosphorylase